MPGTRFKPRERSYDAIFEIHCTMLKVGKFFEPCDELTLCPYTHSACSEPRFSNKSAGRLVMPLLVRYLNMQHRQICVVLEKMNISRTPKSASGTG